MQYYYGNTLAKWAVNFSGSTHAIMAIGLPGCN